MSKSYLDLDLADLKAELRNAYVAKSLESQIKEREAAREIERIRHCYESNLDKMQDLELKNKAEERELESSRNRESYRRELERQIEEKERTRRSEEEEAKRERRLLEEADRFVDEEELREKLRTKRESVERQRRDRRIFEEIKEIRKRTALEAEAEETKRNEEYNVEVEKRAEELKRLELEQKSRREELITKVANMLINFQSKKLERESEMAELVAEEMAWELVIQEREDEIRRKNMRRRLVEDLREQIDYKQECARRTVERDRAFAETVMKRIMEDERIEKLTNEAKLRSRMVYREDLIRLMDERKRMRQRERERIEIELDWEKRLEEIRRNEVFEARKELLVRHAAHVARYVKDRTLTDEERRIVAESAQQFKKS